MDRTQVVRRVIVDIVILGLGGLVLLLFRFLGKPFARGFFCDDETLQHPYKDSTVPSYALYLVGFLGGAILMVIIETIRMFSGLSAPIKDIEGHEFSTRWPLVIRDIYLSLIPFCFGAAIEHIITNIGKYGIGRLRPHFFSVCNIDFSKVNCTAGYVEDFVCTNEDENQVREVRLSFPSGHSSFATYTAIYLIIYLQMKMTFTFNSLLRAFLQTVIFSLAWYTALSRISDYKHHPTDVLAGAIIGIVSAVSVAYGVSDLFLCCKQAQPRNRTDLDNSYNTSI